jgi:hypothetical protein
MCYTSARGFAMKATFNNNLPTQTNDVIVNPENPENPVNPANPDSNTQLLRASFTPWNITPPS